MSMHSIFATTVSMRSSLTVYFPALGFKRLFKAVVLVPTVLVLVTFFERAFFLAALGFPGVKFDNDAVACLRLRNLQKKPLKKLKWG